MRISDWSSDVCSSDLNVQVQFVALGDPRPVMHARPAQRIDAHPDIGAAYRVHVDYRIQSLDISAHEIMAVRRRGAQRFLMGPSPDFLQIVFEQLIGSDRKSTRLNSSH